MQKSTSSTRNNLIMKNIMADPRDQSIFDPFNLTDEQFQEFCDEEGPLSKAVAQYDAEQQVVGLLLQERPRYSLDEFSRRYQEDSSAAQGESEAIDASAVGDGRP